MRLPLLLLISQLFCFPLFGISVKYHFSSDANPAPRFTDSLTFLLDKDGLLNIEDVRCFANSAYTELHEDTKLVAPVALWTSVQLVNDGKHTFDGYFKCFAYADSVWMYTFQDGEQIDVTFTGSALKPWEKQLSSNQNYLPFHLQIGESKTFYFKLHYNSILCNNNCLSTLRVIPRQVLEREVMFSNTFQSSYVGGMLFFGLFSIFMYLMFWESIFLWFSLMMFSFMAYFTSSSGLSALWFNYNSPIEHPEIVLIVSGVIISVTLFLSTYLEMNNRMPHFYRTYLNFSLGVAAFPHIAGLVVDDWRRLLQISDLLTFVWIIIWMSTIVWAARKKEKAMIILLASTLVLFIGSLVYILSLFGVVNSKMDAGYTFQIGTVLFSGTLFYGIFNKINRIKNENKRFEALDQMKSRFFANISHEFRTPLTLMMGPIKDVLANTDAVEDRKRLHLAHQNAERLLQLVNQLLDLSKLESDKMELKTVAYNFPAMLKGIAMSFESLAKRKNIQYHFVAQNENLFLYVDKEKIEKIFYNLLSNAFKFTPPSGEIAVLITEHDTDVEVLVRDSGIGISSNRLPNIFNRFFQGDYSNTHEQEGSGIGLALVKELVELHRGKIQVKSQLGRGTTFTLKFLKGTGHLESHEIYTELDMSTTSLMSTKAPLMPNVPISEKMLFEDIEHLEESEAPVVLIIEDNAAVRDYIKQHLVATFQVIESMNGQDGIKKALELLPDLIISDVMMPKNDGYEVCTILKADERTSHIPIILLTAKASSEEKLIGLETGADDYLVKPFDTQELEVRARNLIQSRLLLRKKFSESAVIEPQAVGTNSLDQAFLAKVCACIEYHLSDEQFGVEALAKDMGLSRSQLNRKLQALTDHSSNKFIQSFRLQRAKGLLLAGAGNVSEIALQTGFNSTAYFVKCFGDKYGYTPGSLLP